MSFSGLPGQSALSCGTFFAILLPTIHMQRLSSPQKKTAAPDREKTCPTIPLLPEYRPHTTHHTPVDPSSRPVDDPQKTQKKIPAPSGAGIFLIEEVWVISLPQSPHPVHCRPCRWTRRMKRPRQQLPKRTAPRHCSADERRSPDRPSGGRR